MEVLVTGAGGFIGSHLVEDQLRRGRRVRALDLHLDLLDHLRGNPDVKLVSGDIRQPSVVDEAISGVDVVFHLASAHLGATIPEEVFWQVNVEATRKLLVACQRCGVSRFVHCSSVGVFGTINNPPLDEESPCHPDIAYERTKLAGEEEAMAFHRRTGFPVVVVRPAWVYGPRCPRTLKLFQMVEEGRFRMVGDGETKREIIYIDDMVIGFELCSQNEGAIGNVYIFGSGAVSLNQLVEEISLQLGVQPPNRRFPIWAMTIAALLAEFGGKILRKEPAFSRRTLKFFTNNTVFDTTKIRCELGFEPAFSLADGIRETCRWYRTLNR